MKRILITDGTVCSKGCVAVGAILELGDGEAMTLVQLNRAVFAPEVAAPAIPAIDNTAGVQPARPAVVKSSIKPMMDAGLSDRQIPGPRRGKRG